MNVLKIACLCCACLIAVQGVHARTVTLVAVEDTWIQGVTGTTIHGSDSALRVCPMCTQWTYLKFDLSSVSGAVMSGAVLGAEVRMTRTSGERPEEISLYRVTEDTWSEAALNGPTRPEPRDPPSTETLATGRAEDEYDVWKSTAITALVRAEIDGDGTLSVMIREDLNSVYDLRTYVSREGAQSLDRAPRLILEVEGAAERFARGDDNSDGIVDISDAVFLLLYLFIEGVEPSCDDAADSNDDGTLDVSDAVTILNYLFLGEVGQPLGICGEDATGDALNCDGPLPCG